MRPPNPTDSRIPYDCHGGHTLGIGNGIGSGRAGDLILAADGDYQLARTPLRIVRGGSAEHPLVVRAEHRGKARITGKGSILVEQAAYLVLEGFYFAQQAVTPALRLTGCHHVRVTRNHFRLQEVILDCHWFEIDGAASHHNRLDHNLFEAKRMPGCYVVTGGAKQGQFLSTQYDRIDHNCFRDRPHGTENGYEAIRLGTSTFAHSSGFITVECNLFDRCDGEAEIISVKTCDDIIRQNTFRDCFGMLTFATAIAIAPKGTLYCGREEAGEPRDSPFRRRSSHRQQLLLRPRRRRRLAADGQLRKPAAKPLYLGGEAGGYLRPRRALIAFNTAVNCGGGFLQIGDTRPEYPLPPAECLIANNLAVGVSGPLVTRVGPAADIKWLGNLFYPAAPAASLGIELPQRSDSRGRPAAGRRWRALAAFSGEPGAARGSGRVCRGDDRHRWPAASGRGRDVGAQQYSAVPVVHRPLTLADVGVNTP